MPATSLTNGTTVLLLMAVVWLLVDALRPAGVRWRRPRGRGDHSVAFVLTKWAMITRAHRPVAVLATERPGGSDGPRAHPAVPAAPAA